MTFGMKTASDRVNEVEHGVPGFLAPEWVTPAEAALLAGASHESVAEAIADARLRVWSSRDGARVLIPGSELSILMHPMPPAPLDALPAVRAPSVVDSEHEDHATSDRPLSRAGVAVAEPARQAPAPDGAAPSDGQRRARSIVALVLLFVGIGIGATAWLLDRGAHESHSSAGAAPIAGAPEAPPSDPTPATSPVDSPPASATVAPPHVAAPAFVPPTFVQHGRWVTPATVVVNPNQDWGLRSMTVTFVVADRNGREIGRRATHVSAPPAGSARVVTTAIPVRPRNAAAAKVLLLLSPARWTPAASFAPTTLHVDGAGFSSTGSDDLTAVASISNSGSERASGGLVCVVENATGGLTGAATTEVSLRPGGGRLIRVPVSHPATGSRQADCQIVPSGR